MREKRFSESLMSKPFESYDEYMDYVFACVNYRLSDYIEGLMRKYDAGQGNYKNVMYPDIEIAHELCSENIYKFFHGIDEDDEQEDMEELAESFDDELRNILDAFGASDEEDNDEDSEEDEDIEEDDDDKDSEEELKEETLTVENMFSFIDARLAVTDTEKVKLPFYELCRKLELGHFSIFSFEK